MKAPDELDAMAEKVLRYKPNKPLKVIAGSAHHPLEIGEIKIAAYVLEDEMRVLSQRGLTEAVGLNPDAGYRIPHLIRSRAIKPHVDELLMPAIEEPIPFRNPTGGRTVYGYPATLLVDICQAVLAARDAGRLTGRQVDVAARCDILIRSLAKVGIIALVDEATGYETIREQNALAKILDKYLADECREWTKTFPYEFYGQIFRLREWGLPSGAKRPSVIGHYTNNVIYARIAPYVLEELQERTPPSPQGWLKNRYHQWFNEKYGHPMLKEHLAGVIALMRAAPTWQRFRESLDLAYPKFNTTLAMPLDLDDEDADSGTQE